MGVRHAHSSMCDDNPGPDVNPVIHLVEGGEKGKGRERETETETEREAGGAGLVSQA